MNIKKVPQEILGVSEPDPRMFGNVANQPNHPRWNNSNWLKSRFHFSFAEYFNPRNQNFGVLRVMNDDLVQPERGFGTHGHRDAEICTYVISGALTHKDSMGTAETLERGAIQFMTAGHGVRHSEHNLGNEPLRFIQMWLTPRRRGLTPNYGSAVGSEADRRNQWAHLVSDTAESESKTDVKINTDANIFVAEIFDGHALPLEISEARQAYMLCLEGNVAISSAGDDNAKSIELAQHDAAEIQGASSMSLTSDYAHVLVVEMAQEPGSGRGDI